MDTTDQIVADALALWPAIEAKQQSHFTQNGAYLQLPWTHAAAPAQPAAPLSSWPQEVVLPGAMQYRMRVDQYGETRSLGEGWTLFIEAIVSGVLMTKGIDCGVDTSRNSAWSAVPSP